LLPLPPKPFAVLAYLVAQAGQVVAKETLLAAVWPDTAVTDGVLKTCLAQIRQVLGETARRPQYIATLYRRGYRFVAPVTVVDVPAASPPRRAAALGECPLSTGPTRAPLPAPPTALAETSRTSRAVLAGERKHVTVLFADLTDSLALIHPLDPEAAQ
jgi:DNA-binding winged helix-turn-helix (wHTH) protein